jgi:hypothetical protein
VLDRLVGPGSERGLQVAVHRDGEQVVDAVAGVADAETERGALDYDTPIVERGRSSAPMARSEMSRLARPADPGPVATGDEEPPALSSPRAPDGWVGAPPAAVPVAAFGNRADLLAADIPATGTMTARAVARMYAALMHDVEGVRLIPDTRLREATAPAVEGVDAVFSFPVQRGLGYAVGGRGGVFEALRSSACPAAEGPPRSPTGRAASRWPC